MQKEEVVYKGKIFEVVEMPQADGRVFEKARRAPGTRLIIVDIENKKVLLTEEFRRELDAWDYRLPGGKVFDTLDEYEAFRVSDGDMLEAATSKAKAEAAEEAGVDVLDLELYEKSTLGATVEWDLFVFEVTNWQPHAEGQNLEAGEQIKTGWHSFKEAEEMILSGQMQEHRVALILLKWLKGKSE